MTVLSTLELQVSYGVRSPASSHVAKNDSAIITSLGHGVPIPLPLQDRTNFICKYSDEAGNDCLMERYSDWHDLGVTFAETMLQTV